MNHIFKYHRGGKQRDIFTQDAKPKQFYGIYRSHGTVGIASTIFFEVLIYGGQEYKNSVLASSYNHNTITMKLQTNTTENSEKMG